MYFARFYLNYLIFNDISFIIDFFKFKNIHHGVIFHCDSEILTSRIFYDNYIKISSKNLYKENFAYIHNSFQKIGIVINASCDDWENIFNGKDMVEYFKSPFVWLILTANLTQTTNIMKQFPIEIDSDVTIAYKINNDFGLFDVYNTGFGKNGLFVRRKVGVWNKTLHLDKMDRHDLKGLVLKSVVVINQNQKVVNSTFETYLDTERPNLNKADPMHKFKFFEVLKYFKDLFNISYEFRRTDSWGYPTNGSFDGMMGALQRLEADIGGSPLFIRTDRAKAVDYAAETWQTKPCFIFRHPKHPSGFFTIYTRPLASKVWYCIVTVMIIASTILALMLRMNVLKLAGDNEDSSTSLAILFIWSALCQQGMSIARSSTSIQIIVFVTFIFTLTLYQYYNATVVSTLLREPPKNIRTMDDLIKSNLKAGIEDVLYNKDFFKRTTDPLAITMYHKKISTSTGFNFFPSETGMSLVKKGGFAFHVDSAVAYRIMRRTFSEKELCEAQEISMFVPQFLGVAVVKRSPYKEHIAYAIRKLKESGIMYRMRYLWDESRPLCVRTPDTSIFSVSIREFSTALIVLTVGYIAAIIVLFGEILVAKLPGRYIEFTP